MCTSRCACMYVHIDVYTCIFVYKYTQLVHQVNTCLGYHTWYTLDYV